MNTNEIISILLSVLPEGSTMVRRSKQNFIAVPVGQNEEGITEYMKVAVGTLLAKDTTNHSAFDYDAAVAEYEAWDAAQKEKASAPKKSKGRTPDPAKQEAAKKRQQAALTWLRDNSGEHTATEIKAAIDPENAVTIMQIGSDLKEIVKGYGEDACPIVADNKGGKNYWSYVG